MATAAKKVKQNKNKGWKKMVVNASEEELWDSEILTPSRF